MPGPSSRDEDRASSRQDGNEPESYFYFASEWCNESRSKRVIVLEHHH
jgi:hypothetical protein